MKALDQMWADYESATVPENAHAIQRQMTKEAFYAGAAAVFGTITQFEDGPDSIEVVLMSLRDSLDRFVDEAHALRGRMAS